MRASWVALRQWVFFASLLALIPAAYAQQTFSKALIGSAGPYQTGESVTYRLQGSCNNLISGCGALSISDSLPPELVLASCPTSSFFGGGNGSISCGAGTITLVRNVYAGGDTFSLDIIVRVNPAITVAASNIINTATATITGFVNPSNAAPISVATPTPQYVVRKQRTDPSTGLAIAPGTAVTYRVQLCPNSTTGNMPLTSAVLTDTLPATTPALTAASIEVPNGGTIAFPNISWNLDDTTPPPTGLLGLNNGSTCAERTFVVRYPAGIAVGTVVTNTINGTVVPVAGPAPVIGPVGRTDTIGGAAAAGSSSKSAPDVAPGTGDIVFSITANTNGSNTRVPAFEVVDRLPNTPLPTGLTFASVSSGRWSSPTDGNVSSDVRATIQYTTAAPIAGVCDFTGATAIATNIVSPGVATVFLVPASIPANATCIRWQFSDFGAGGPSIPRNWSFTTAPQVRYSVNAGTVIAPSTLQNCTNTNFTGAPLPRSEVCVNARVEQATPSVRPAKSFTPGSTSPGNTFNITMSANHVAGDSTAPLTGIVLSDWLPVQLEYVGFVSSAPGGQVVQVTPNYGSPGRTLVRVSYPTLSVPLGSTGPSVTFQVRVREGVLSNPAYVNDLAVFLSPGAFTCPNNTAPIIDTNDLNNNGSNTDLYCSTTANFGVTDSFVLGGEKWIEGDATLPNVDDPTLAPVVADNTNCPDYDSNFGGPVSNFTRLPCVAQTTHGGAFRYRLRLANAGNRLLEEYVAYDALPSIGDVGVGQPLSTQTRDTRWVPTLNGPITATVVVPPLIQLINPQPASYATDARVQIEYTTNGNFCRGEVRTADFAPAAVGTAALINSYPAGCDASAVFSTTPPSPISLTRGFRIRAFSTLTAPASSIDWVPGTYIEVDMPMLAPATGAPPSFVGGTVPNVVANASFFNPAWNSFAHRVFRAGAAANTDLLPTAEPPKVGIVLPELYRLGNLVWLDNGNAAQRNNGLADSGEPGINGVNVRLCRDTDGTLGASAGDTVIGNTLTANIAGQDGKYAFASLPPGANYYLAVTDVANQSPLVGRRSTFNDELLPNNDVDNNDNGIGINGAGLVSACGAGASGSIVSGLVALGPVSASAVLPEPSNEVLRIGGVDDDNDSFPDPASNFSVDFGFIEPVDLGDLPDTGAGVSSNNYETLLANNGAVHPLLNATRLGASVDAETNGQPSATADLDDTTGVPDDEDGVVVADLTQFETISAPVRVNYNATAASRICGFIDYNNDGIFTGVELAQADVAVGAGVATLTFGPVPAASAGNRYARFRISSGATACSATGSAVDGEVEDYVVQVLNAADFGDLPDAALGVGPGNYNTVRVDGGAGHVLRDGLRLGACNDAETDGQPINTASGDDTGAGVLTQGVCAVANDDEDGVTVTDLAVSVGNPAVVRVNATNTVGTPAQICGFFDFNGDGDFADPGESAAPVAVPTGSNGVIFNVSFGIVPITAVSNSFARFRLSTILAACSASGLLTDGEVEDYVTGLNINDRGDLPDTGPGFGIGNYRTTIADGGPFHPIVAGLFMGTTNDGELDGQPSATAVGDDVAGVDDEDGVDVSTLQFVVGQPRAVTVRVTNTTGADARLCGFVDFNGDGQFDAGVETQQAIVPTGSLNAAISLNYTKPLSSPSGNTYARFRISSDLAGACADSGAASNGEVEDYVVGLRRIDLGDLPDTAAGTGPVNYNTLIADNGAQHEIITGLFMGALVDNEADGQPNATADGDDTAGTTDDEDGINVADLTINVGNNSTVPVTATNTTAAVAQLCGFIDFNADGDFLDAGETAPAVNVPAGSNGVVLPLNFGIVSATAATVSYARFRISNTIAACAAVGAQLSGEVEDYRVTINSSDRGDLPDTGAGVGAGNYRTLLADGGPSHPIVAGLRLGLLNDGEGNGQAAINADGDDLTGLDDEDGVDVATLDFTIGQPRAVTVRATNTTGAAATICGLIDFNADGQFDTGSEIQQVSVPAGSNNVAFSLNFTKPLSSPAGRTYARLRISTDTSPCSDGGVATNGEVEDYVVGLRRVDLGDLPDTGAAIGAGNYRTLLADGGPQHEIVTGLFMGALVDNEADGQPNAAANLDDTTGSVDDEDGVNVADLTLIPAAAVTNVRVTATNLTTSAAKVCGFLDFNADGDFMDAGEVAQAAVPIASNALLVTLAFGARTPASALNSYARFRLSTSTAACSSDGVLLDGEVEDYAVSFQPYDLGDLPDTGAGTGVGNYQTRVTDLGAVHGIISGLRLGACIDAEADGQPLGTAQGDDTGAGTFTSGTCAAANDDEDGVTLRTEYNSGSPSTTPAIVTNQTASAATLCGFIDWNGDGDFADLRETAQVNVPAGSNNLSVLLDFGVVPSPAAANTFGRFRISTVAGCSATGLVVNGEVEDYAVVVGIGAMSLGNLVWEDLNNNGVVNPGEPGIPGVPVRLFLDANNDGSPDGAALLQQNTDANGNYLFVDLQPNHYIVEITPPSRYTVSTGTGRRWLATGPYEPAPDPDNDINNDDNGTINAVVNYRSASITLSAKGEPINDGDNDVNSNLTVDFGLLTNFDLAIRKTLAVGQGATVTLGDSVRFSITVFNQGTIDARNIVVSDYIPFGMALNDPNWTAVSPTLATRTIPGPLLPGTSTSVDIVLRVTTSSDVLTNAAEISVVTDGNGNPIRDKDSDPDGNPGNDGSPIDDETGNVGGDEDDADFATVSVMTQIPTNNAFGLLLMIVMLGLLGSRRLRS